MLDFIISGRFRYRVIKDYIFWYLVIL